MTLIARLAELPAGQGKAYARRMRKLTRIALLGLLAAGCGGAGSNPQPPAFAPANQSTCKVQKSQSNPLIVEWPSAERASLEARARQGLVVVRYDGCELQLLTRCTAPGVYNYLPVSRKQDSLRIRNEDELWASMPIGAASLEGKLHNGGELGVNMTLVGTYQSDRVEVKAADLQGICDGATHVIGGLSVGAFEFFSAASAETGGGASVAGVGAGVTTKRSQEVLATDGRPESCERSSSKDAEPPDGCGALLRIEVIPIAGKPAQTAAKAAGAPPAPKPEEPPKPLVAPNETVHRYVNAANGNDRATQIQIATSACWSGECGRFSNQAGSKFRAEVGEVEVNGTRAIAGVSIICPSVRSKTRSSLPISGPWMAFPARPLAGMAEPPMPAEEECDFVNLYLEYGTGGWRVAWIDENRDHAAKYLAGALPAILK